jgi:preprotein translocase subunit SecE
MIEKIQNFFTGSYEELKKVVWPSRQVVTSHTIIVIVSIIVAMAVVAAIDYGLFSAVQWLIYRS